MAESRKVDLLVHIQAALDKALDGAAQKKLRTLVERLQREWTDCKSKTQALRQSRDQLATTLSEIRTLVGKERIFSQILEAYGISRSTAYDLLEDHQRIAELELPPAVKKAAASAHVDLTAKRLAPAIERQKSKLKSATTTEQAEKAVAALIKGGKRKSPVRDTTISEVRAVRQRLAVAQMQAFLESVKADPETTDFQAAAEVIINEVVADFGFIAKVSMSAERKGAA